MQLLKDNIASWEDPFQSLDEQGTGIARIATEEQPCVNSEWEKCIDALLKLLSTHPTDELAPNECAIKTALSWVAFLQKQHPGDPPTCIVREPNGGVIVERRVRFPNGPDSICELTFYNNGIAERTDYVDGKILRMGPIPSRP